MILIGSRALQIRAPMALSREPKDFDFLCTEEEFDLWKKENSFRKMEPIDIPSGEKFRKEYLLVDDTPCEFEIVTPGKSSEIAYQIVVHDSKTVKTSFGLIPSLDFLFTLKTSHRYLKNSPHFWKNLADWHKMRMLGASIPDEWKSFLSLREKETYNYSHPKLNVRKNDFFKDDAIQYVYDHDSIHRAIAHFERPAYTYYMKDGEEVACDKNKFFSLPEEYRMWGVIEEACVLAIERSLVPHPGKLTPKQAWMFAFSKVATSITSGWFRQYAYENAFEVIKNSPDDYFDRFQEGVSNGTVLPFNPDVPNNPYK